MPVITAADKPAGRPVAQAAVVLAGLLLALAMAACALGAAGVRLGALRPPTFSITFAGHELAAPCPQALSCDINQPYYALWRGDQRPDGSWNFHELFFMWLKRGKP
jgi:hypothetical protein